MFYFSEDDIVFLHSKLIDDFGGMDGIRDQDMLESAINAPLQTFDESDVYQSDIEKIARLSYGLAMNHPFIDGNKRIAALSLDLGLSGNGIELKAADEDIISEFIGLASGRIEFAEFLRWVKASSF